MSRPDRPGDREREPDRPGADERGSDRPGAGERGSDRPGAGERGPVRPGASERGSDRPGAGVLRADRPGAGELGPDRRGAGERGPEGPLSELDPARLLARAVDAAWRLDPELGLLFGRLADRCEVAFVDGVGTARIRPHGRGARVELDPEFVRAELRAGEDLLFLLAHEVMHRVQGDLLRGHARSTDPLDHLAANVTADARINAALRGRFFRAPVGLLERSYGEADFPARLLLPPDALLRRATGRDVPWRGLPAREAEVMRAARGELAAAGLPGRVAMRLARWYTRAWLHDVAQPPLVRALRDVLPELPVCRLPLLLGDHTGDDARAPDRPGALDPDLEALLRELAGHLAHGRGGALREARVALRLQDELAALRRRLRRALTLGASRVAREATTTARLVVPAVGRREAVFLAQGLWPGLFTHQVAGHGEDPSRVHVYLDVSGSLDEHLPRVYALLTGLRDLLADPVWAFSTEVAPLPLARLAEGHVPTTGGTDFTPVVEHALARAARRILVVTDGMGPLEPRLARRARERGLEVHLLLTPDGQPAPELARLARTTERLGR